MKPALFSTDMIFSIIKRIKNQTRRTINPQPIINEDSGHVFDGKHRKIYDIHNWKDQFIKDWAKYQINDLIYVRETWCYAGDNGVQDGRKNYYDIIYRASKSGLEFEENCEGWRWKPSIFLKKKDSRIILKCTNVRIEKVQDISEQDAIDEGIERWTEQRMKSKPTHYKVYWWPKGDDGTCYSSCPILSYETLWKKINKEKSWDDNPWVFVYDFKIHEI